MGLTSLLYMVKNTRLADDFLAVDDVNAFTQVVVLDGAAVEGGDGLRSEGRTADGLYAGSVGRNEADVSLHEHYTEVGIVEQDILGVAFPDRIFCGKTVPLYSYEYSSSYSSPTKKFELR